MIVNFRFYIGIYPYDDLREQMVVVTSCNIPYPSYFPRSLSGLKTPVPKAQVRGS